MSSFAERVPRVRTLFRWTLLLSVLVLVIRHVVRNWPAVLEVQTPQWIWFLPASALAGIALLGFALVLWVLVRAHGQRVTLPVAVGLFFVPMLGKYLPGKLWSILAGFWLYARVGIDKTLAALVMAVSIIVSLVSASCVTALFGLPNVGLSSPLALPLLATALLFILRPGWLFALMNRILQMLGRDPVSVELSPWTLFRMVLLNSIVWVLYGAGFFCLTQSISHLDSSFAPEMIGLFAFAQVIGFLAFFAPAGIGVREGLFVVGLAPVVGQGDAIVIAALCRIWQTLLEALMALIGWLALEGYTREREKGF